MPAAPDTLERLGVGVLSSASDDPGFLDPDVAFVVSVSTPDSGTVSVSWEIADTYYLYREKLRFIAKAPATITIGSPSLPSGRVEVYYGAVEAVIPIERRPAEAENLTLEVGYQGCTDRGLCYSPVTRTFSIPLPPG